MVPEHQVKVKAQKDGRWAQEPWKPQLQVVKGDIVEISISFAMRLEKAGLGKIIKEKSTAPKQVKKKVEKNPPKDDKEAAEG